MAVSARWFSQGKLVILLGLLISVLTMSFAAFQILTERERSLALWRESAEAESGALAAHARQTFTAADLVLKSVIERATATGVATVEDMRRALGTAEVHEMLRDRQGGVPQISVASIVDINGDMVNFTRNFPPRSNTGGRINLRERDYFQAHLKDPALDLFLSEPVENKGTGSWTFYLARKLRSPDGAMLGVVLTGLESDYFQDFYKQIAVPGKAYALFHANGSNLARWPVAEGVVGANYSNASVFRLLRDERASAVLEPGQSGVASGSSGEMRIVAPTALRNYPAVVTVRVSGSLALESWRRSMTSTLTLACGLSLIAAVMTIVLYRLLRRNAQVIKDLEAARHLSDVAARAKTEFLATMSHEIRTPMNAVVGLISLLGRTRMDPEQERLLRIVSESADGLLGVVNDVLDFSTLDAGKQGLVKESFSVARLVDGVVAVARAYPGAEPLTLTGEIAADVPPYLLGDRPSLSRLLLNLMHNAVKFTAQGSVTLSVRMEARSDGAPLVLFAVRDSGAGVPQAMQDKIFEPFEQASSGRLSPHRGTGLGLAICRRIAVAMGGDITLDSAEGAGSTFTCRLPLEPGSPVEEPTARPAAGAVGRRLNLLVAEDTPASQLVIRLILEGMGHQVRVVDDGAQAVRAFGEEAFDLVFLDVQMPVMNGYEAARAIRAAAQTDDPARRAVKIIGLSAFAQPADRKAALDSGMDDYLAKPIRAGDLAALMERNAPDARTGSEPQPPPPSIEPATTLSKDDRDVMIEFFDVMGPKGFAEAIALFERDTRIVVAEIQTLANNQDEEGVRRAAHRLKGVFGQFGAADAAALAAQIERLPGRAQSEAVVRLIDMSPGAIEMVLRESRAVMAQRAAKV